MVPDINSRQKIKWDTRKGNEIGAQEINSDINSQTRHERTTSWFTIEVSLSLINSTIFRCLTNCKGIPGLETIDFSLCKKLSLTQHAADPETWSLRHSYRQECKVLKVGRPSAPVNDKFRCSRSHYGIPNLKIIKSPTNKYFEVLAVLILY